MFRKKLLFLEPPLSNKTYKRTHQNTIPLILGIVFIALFTITGFAFVQFDGQPDGVDLFSREGGTMIRDTSYILPTLRIRGYHLAIAALSPILEYLQIHVGEKRPADFNNKSNCSSSFWQLKQTTLFCRVVCLFLYPGSQLTGSSLIPLYGSIHSNFSLYGGFLSIMKSIFRLNLPRENF